MRRVLIIAVVAMFSVAPSHHQDDLKQELIRLEKAWLAAYDNNDKQAMDRIVANDFTICYGSGEVLDKKQTIAKLDRAAKNPTSKQYTVGTKVRLYGDTAVLTGIYVGEWTADGEKHTTRSRYTDTYVKIDGRWQVVASHLTNLYNE